VTMTELRPPNRPGPRRSVVLGGGLNVALAVAVVVLTASPAFAAGPPTHGGGRGGGSGGGGSTTPTGIDVSYPQCPGTSLPAGEAFAIVGVNGGLANDYNSCLAAEFSYASGLTKATSQPVAQLYVNTADPSNTVADWPYGTDYLGTDPLGAYPASTTPYGPCTGKDATAACAYVYGYDMVAGVNGDDSKDNDDASNNDGDVDIPGDLAYFQGQSGATASGYQWWLDVETGNSWQSGSSGLQMNVADLEGMVAAFQANGVTSVGVYSTSSQWNTITGTPTSGTLSSLPDWIPGARSLGGAESNCSLHPFTNGGVAVTQWFGHPYDGDYAC
jgi:hypothetical protein